MSKSSSRGFTIIELLIATVVFSVILLILTGAIVQFGRIYYRGNVDSKTKEATRAVMNSIAQDIQFGSTVAQTPNSLTNGTSLAIGPGCYDYQLGVQVKDGYHAITRQNNSICPSPPSFGGHEFLGENMQLVSLTVKETSPGSGLYRVSVHVVYGSDDDFTDDTKKSCKPIIKGGQFCSVAELSTVVAKRIK